MNYIVLDMEWNQPLSKTAYPYTEVGDRLEFEILQIGAVKLDEAQTILGTFDVTIRPQYYKKLHFQVKKITGLSQEALLTGLCFKEAMRQFFEFCGPAPVFVTWGYDDMPILEQNLRFYAMDTAACAHWYNLQVMYNTQLNQGLNQKGLSTALEFFSIVPEEKFHNALNDAYYTALVLQKLNMQAGMRTYVEDVYGYGFCKLVELAAQSDPETVLQNADAALSCPDCGGAFSPQQEWVGAGNLKFLKIAVCPQHGAFYLQLKIKKALGGRFWGTVVVRRADDALRMQVAEKAEKERRRKEKLAARGAAGEEPQPDENIPNLPAF